MSVLIRKTKKLRRWQVLEHLINTHNYRRIVELGVFRGETMKYLLEKCPDIHYIGVDTFIPLDPTFDLPKHLKKTELDTGYRSYSQFPLDEYKADCVRLAQQYSQRTELLIHSTLDAANLIENASVDLVFIDADHTPAGVENDIRIWARKIRPGGLLTGHDENMPCIRTLLQNIVPGYNTYDDSVWVIPIEKVHLNETQVN